LTALTTAIVSVASSRAAAVGTTRAAMPPRVALAAVGDVAGVAVVIAVTVVLAKVMVPRANSQSMEMVN
jgi:uncharacterized membrane protein